MNTLRRRTYGPVSASGLRTRRTQRKWSTSPSLVPDPVPGYVIRAGKIVCDMLGEPPLSNVVPGRMGNIFSFMTVISKQASFIRITQGECRHIDEIHLLKVRVIIINIWYNKLSLR